MQIKAVIRIASVAACASVLQFSAASAATEKVVYAFKGGTDGAAPQASLLDVKGVLYGTTSAGGGTCAAEPAGGCGTVFKVTLAGKEKVPHSFQGGNDGYDPTAGLIDVKGTLYGTTSSGVTLDLTSCTSCGTVFSITASGTEKVLHVFTGGSDGAGPRAALVNVADTLYGTTAAGGGNCLLGIGPCGVVFSVSRSGTEKVLHVFNTSEGYNPYADLTNVSGKLYGTTVLSGDTLSGGACPLSAGGSFNVGCGAVFSITPGGAEKAIYTFEGGLDGGASYAGITPVNGTLYGTTSVGGAGGVSCSQYGCGTAFSVTRSGIEKVLYTFKGGSDGSIP